MVNVLNEREYECLAINCVQSLGRLHEIQPSKKISQSIVQLVRYKSEWVKIKPDFAIAFDIDALGGGTYGLSAWSAVWKHCNVDQAANTALFEGDSSSTLEGSERVYLCGFYGLDEDVRNAFIKAMDASSEAAYLGCLYEEAAYEPLVQNSFVCKNENGEIIIEDEEKGWAAPGLEQARKL